MIFGQIIVLDKQLYFGEMVYTFVLKMIKYCHLGYSPVALGLFLLSERVLGSMLTSGIYPIPISQPGNCTDIKKIVINQYIYVKFKFLNFQNF